MDTLPDNPARPLQQFLTAFSLYLLWCTLAWASDFLGYTSLPRESAVVLMSGITATNLLFVVMACANVKHQPPTQTVALAQCVLGIVWVTLYTFLSTGAGELVSGIYITTFLFATVSVGRRSLFHLAIFSVVSYGLVILVKSLVDLSMTDLWRESIHLAIFTGVIGWLIFYRLPIQRIKPQIPGLAPGAANEQGHAPDHDYFTKSFNQRYIMDSLTREKGWTDRSNNPFSICIFDIDSFNALSAEHGTRVSERILEEFSHRVRGALRAMDTVKPTGIERTLGRFSNEEYIAILPHTSLRGAERCADRTRQAIADTPFERKHDLTISAGVAEYRRGETIAKLLARAEQALHEAIQTGGNRVCGGSTREPGSAQVIELHKLNS